MFRRKQNIEEEQRLLDKNNGAEGGINNAENLPQREEIIPKRAIKSIIIGILLVLLGILCLIFFLGSFGGPFEYSFGEHRYILFIISLIITPAGSYTLYLAYKCYYRIDGYRWPMLFL